jgi:8-oxo-dGTP diphosphatase
MNLETRHAVTYQYDTEDKVLAAVDCIIFGFDEEDLKVLLIKRGFEPEKGKWSLVGGFLKKEETLEDSATRILELYTGLENIFMEQVSTFSEVDRDPVERTISTAYYALVNIREHSKNLIKQFSAKWFSVSKAPRLIFDHDRMVRHALQKLRNRSATEPIGFDLLPQKFTMRQLQKLYEAIWDAPFDKRNFINKINSLNIIDKLDEKDMTTSRKGSYLYQFNAEKYEKREGKLLI